MQLLAHSFSPSASELALKRLSEEVEAPWWASPPWVSDGYNAKDMDVALWHAAIATFREHHEDDFSILVAVGGISSRATERVKTIEEGKAISEWARLTAELTHATRPLRESDWQYSAVGCAIQLVLLRPGMTRFRAWVDDLQGLPPIVWWSATVLFGVLHGYRNLDIQLRGDAVQRRLLALHAVEKSYPMDNILPSESPEVLIRGDQMGFRWGNDVFSLKSETPRRRWYWIDLSKEANRQAAEDVSRRNDWRCLQYEFSFDSGSVEFSRVGERTLNSSGGETSRFHGHVSGSLPLSATVTQRLEPSIFRKCVLLAGGRNIPLPPGVVQSSEATRKALPDHVPPGSARILPVPPVRITQQAGGGEVRILSRGDLERSQVEVRLLQKSHAQPSFQEGNEDSALTIPGLVYQSTFLTDDAASEVVANIDSGVWSTEIQRRVQHYGWKYNYRSQSAARPGYLGALPRWAMTLAEKMISQGLLLQMPDQVIVNEYVGAQGIARHIDDPRYFADGVAMISLLESWTMIFRLGKIAKRLRLAANSVAIMTGDARYRWSHEIPQRLRESKKGPLRGRRISVTFRHVLANGVDA